MSKTILNILLWVGIALGVYWVVTVILDKLNGTNNGSASNIGAAIGGGIVDGLAGAVDGAFGGIVGGDSAVAPSSKTGNAAYDQFINAGDQQSNLNVFAGANVAGYGTSNGPLVSGLFQ